MRSPLTSPKEYRDFAAQCLRWAARAKSEQHKNVMFQMADHWMQIAQELERSGRSPCAPSRAGLASTLVPRDGVQPETRPSKGDFKRA
jgi:hypothetical protein